VHKDDGHPFHSGRDGERPTHDSPPPALGQQAASFTDQLIDVDVVQCHEQEEHHYHAEYEGTGSGVADQWAHRERSYDRRQQGAVSVGREMTAGRFAQLFQQAFLDWNSYLAQRNINAKPAARIGSRTRRQPWDMPNGLPL
jgi:hypothetical protein